MSQGRIAFVLGAAGMMDIEVSEEGRHGKSVFESIKNKLTHTEADPATMGDLHVPWEDLHVPWEDRVRPRSSPEGGYRSIWEGETCMVSHYLNISATISDILEAREGRE